MTCSNPPLPSLILSKGPRKMEKLYHHWNFFSKTGGIRNRFYKYHEHIFFSKPFCLLPPTQESNFRLFFFPKICNSWSDQVQYICQWKLEVATRSSYTWVKPMSELWRFVYIACHVTLQAKPDAQKVNYYLFKIGRKESPACFCGFYSESGKHFLHSNCIGFFVWMPISFL